MPNSQPAAPRRPFGLAPLGFLDLPPPDLVSLAAAAGFSSCALRTVPATPGGAAFALHDDPPLLRETRRRIADTGVAVTQIELIALSEETDIAALGPVLDAAAEVGARQVLCSGDDALDVVSERFAALCDAAGARGLSPCLEFMPFRALKTLADARAVVRAAGRPNGAICIDLLHLIRSGGSPEDLSALEPEWVGAIQICDAPLTPPPPEGLAEEARERRMLPGTGGLPLRRILEALPRDCPLDAEVPIAAAFPDASPRERAGMIHAATAAVLAQVQP